MSMTITTTLPSTTPSTQPQPLTLRLTTPVSTEDKIRAYLVKINTSSLLPPSLLQTSQQLSSTYTTQYLNDLTTDHGKENGAIALSLFIHDVIHPAILNEVDEDKQRQLLELEDEVQSLLKELLPEGVTVENYIEQNQSFSDEQFLVDEKLLMIEASFQNQMRSLFSAANLTNEQLQQAFETLKQKLFEITTDREVVSNDLHSQLDSLTLKVNTLSRQLQEEAINTQDLSQKMKNQEHNFHQIIKMAQDLFKKV